MLPNMINRLDGIAVSGQGCLLICIRMQVVAIVNATDKTFALGILTVGVAHCSHNGVISYVGRNMCNVE